MPRTTKALVIAVNWSPFVNALRAMSSSAAPGPGNCPAAATAPPRVSRAATAASGGMPSTTEPAMALR